MSIRPLGNQPVNPLIEARLRDVPLARSTLGRSDQCTGALRPSSPMPDGLESQILPYIRVPKQAPLASCARSLGIAVQGQQAVANQVDGGS